MTIDRYVATSRCCHLKVILLIAWAEYRAAFEVLVDTANSISKLQKIVKVELVADQCERGGPHREYFTPA